VLPLAVDISIKTYFFQLLKSTENSTGAASSGENLNQKIFSNVEINQN
jgi:hypothetical protein